MRAAEDGAAIVHGCVLIAAPDHHLIVHPGRVGLSRVVGVLLSGALDDGTAGLDAIRRCGGKAYAKAPHEAAFPETAGNNVEGVHTLTTHAITAELIRLSAAPQLRATRARERAHARSRRLRRACRGGGRAREALRELLQSLGEPQQ